ncbi:MAG TPA: hypothetical protein PK668_21270 [Myxococcota bacterium]|nr:hypothetical protein [Myxococcota bacterium]HRY96007.1 hypothetical protein [Myxococcota bacterium]HSA21691.1 hypothetical protein [Myxococcota bacterium]
MGLVKGLRALHTLAITGVLGGVCLAVGLPEVVTYFQNPEPATLTCAEADKAGREGWVAISGCRLLLAEAAHETWSDPNELRKVLVPLAAPGTGEDAALGLVLQSEDPALLAKVRELRDAGRRLQGLQVQQDMIARDPRYADFVHKTLAQAQTDVLQARTRLQELLDEPGLAPVRDARGMLRGPGWLNERTVADLRRELGPRLAPGFRLLEDGATPRLAWPLTLSVLGNLFGLAFLGTLIAAFAGRR